jgi:tetratricopeptide (TPR) repeat protein
MPERLSGSPPWGGLFAVAATLVVLVGAFLLIDGGGRQEPSRSDSPGAATSGREPSREAPGAVAAQAAEVPEPAGEDAALGDSLNQEGFELIQAGRHEEAVPLLEEAVRAFPPDTDDLNYAYALFNLGNALRLSGRPEDAVPVLERRLEIPNQTDAVSRELEIARDEAGP